MEIDEAEVVASTASYAKAVLEARVKFLRGEDRNELVQKHIATTNTKLDTIIAELNRAAGESSGGGSIDGGQEKQTGGSESGGVPGPAKPDGAR